MVEAIAAGVIVTFILTTIFAPAIWLCERDFIGTGLGWCCFSVVFWTVLIGGL